MTRRCLIPLLLVFSLGVCSAAEGGSEGGGGCILYGKNWAVALSAPEGWSMACQGPSDDVEVALWPEGSSWADAKVVMYVNSSAPEGETLEKFIEGRVAGFKKEQPSVVVREGAPLVTGDKRKALVRHFTGDQWGNYEAVSYLDGGTTVLLIVLSSRSEEAFKISYPAFESLVSKVLFMERSGGN